MSRYYQCNPDEPIKHDWITPQYGVGTNPTNGLDDYNASERRAMGRPFAGMFKKKLSLAAIARLQREYQKQF